MVAVIVGLKLTLLRNGLRRSVWRIVALVIGLVYGVGIVLGCWAGLVALRFAPADLAAAVTVLGFGLLTVGWLLMSLLVFGSDETVDPAKFALLPVPARRLQPGLFLAGLIGVPGIATTLIAAGLIATWSRNPVTVVAAVITVPLGVATCSLLARTATSAFAQALSSRRFRDFAAVALALFGASIGLAINAVTNASRGFEPTVLLAILHRTGEVIGWTPIGWIWSVPAETAVGSPVIAVIKLLLAAAFLAVLWLAWRYFLSGSLTSPLESGGSTRTTVRGNLAERLFPDTPAGAIASRVLLYWRRDPRYLAAIGGICVAPIIVIVTQLINVDHGSRPVAAFAPVFISLLLGSVVTTDISYDGSALWIHVVTGVSGMADRAGRAMATAVVIGPIVVIMTVAAVLLSGEAHLFSVVLALTIGLGLIGLGVGCWAGSVWQVPVPPPGQSPFQRNNSGGLASLASMGASTGLTVIIGLPTIVLVILSYWFGWLAYLAIVVGIVSGALAIRYGVRIGGRRLEARWPEVLTRVSAKT